MALDKRRIQVRNTTVVICCAALLVVSFLVSMSTGYLRLSPADTLRTLFGGGTERETLILFGFRLPRIVISMLAGSGLALSGRMIQGVSQNALADPGLLGINSGAGIMVVLYVLFFGGTTALSLFALPFLAFLGAGLTAALIYLLSWRKGEGASPMRLLLTGVAMQAGLLALTTLLVVKLDETQYSFFASWQAGSIWGSNWKYVSALLPWLLILVPYVLSRARVLDVLSLGDDAAVGLGVNVQRERKCLLAVAVALAAACVAVSGNISFVGLIAPHLAHRLVGPRHRVLLPVCALVGALLVSAADTIARIILQPSGLPTGIVVAVIGAPYFLYLLIKSKE
ncbi:Iron-uptake system permease protein FeuC [bioreactor metagenome]|uniref:Iron-uptake system permease protein FeuC n=1 Tax=bioreactor metagenome TaxID=1076179 RepID=A0A644XG73_9ZZZZ